MPSNPSHWEEHMILLEVLEVLELIPGSNDVNLIHLVQSPP